MNKKDIFSLHTYILKFITIKKNHRDKLFKNLTYIHIYNYKNKYIFTVKITYESELLKLLPFFKNINFFFFA